MAEPAGMSEKDLRALQTEQAVQGLHTGARMLGRNVREVLFIGWGGRTAGGPSDAGTWLSVKHRPRQSQVSRHWHGLEDAYAIGEELQRPAFLHAIAGSKTISSTGWKKRPFSNKRPCHHMPMQQYRSISLIPGGQTWEVFSIFLGTRARIVSGSDKTS